LSGTHTLRQLGLREPSANASGDQFASESEFFIKSGVGLPNFTVSQHFLFH